MRISSEISSLQGKLIDVQQQTLDLQNENHTLREEVRQLKTKLGDTVQAEPCPRCHQKSWHVASSSPDPIFGKLGGLRRVYHCKSCGFNESRLSD